MPSPQLPPDMLAAATHPDARRNLDHRHSPVHVPSYFPPNPALQQPLPAPLYSSLSEGFLIPQSSEQARIWVPRNRPMWEEDSTTYYSDQWSFASGLANSFPAEQLRADTYPTMAADPAPSAYPQPLRQGSACLDDQQPPGLYMSPTYANSTPLNPYEVYQANASVPYPLDLTPGTQSQLGLSGRSYGIPQSPSFNQPMYTDHQQQQQQQQTYNQAYSLWPNLPEYPPPPQHWSGQPQASPCASVSVKPERQSPIPDTAGMKRRLQSDEGQEDGKRPKFDLDFHRIHGVYASILDSLQYVQPANSHPPQGEGVPFQALVDMAGSCLDLCQRTSGYPSPARPEPRIVPTSEPAVESKPPCERHLSARKKDKETNGKKDREGLTVCLGCNTTETPEWRKGPLGPRTLCNACGLVFAKLVAKRKKQAAKEAAAAVSAAAGTGKT